jgi:hypothetical protein
MTPTDSLVVIEGKKYVKIDDIITATEIAALCGVGVPAVSNWRARHDSFPLPFLVVNKKTAMFLKPEIVAWFAEHVASDYAPEIKTAIMAQLSNDQGE